MAQRGKEPAKIRQIANATRVPEGYLAKVLLSLSKAGIVKSQRGPTGGSVLARPPEEISIYDVTEAVDPIPRIKTCPLGLKTHGTNLCAVHKRVDAALALVEKTYRESTLAELLAEPNESRPLCETPAAAADRKAEGKVIESWLVKMTVKKNG